MRKTIQPGALQRNRAGRVLLEIKQCAHTVKANTSQISCNSGHQLDQWPAVSRGTVRCTVDAWLCEAVLT